MPSTYNPCFPESFIQKLKSDPKNEYDQSKIHKPEFNEYRLSVISHKADPRQEVIKPVLGNLGVGEWSRFRAGDQKNWLHYAASNWDVPLAHESIRLGVGVDSPDNDGTTPLFTACQYLSCNAEMVKIMSSHSLPETYKGVENALGGVEGIMRGVVCCSDIAILLLEQHANPNVERGELTPLSVACSMRQWPLIEALLQHGAIPRANGRDLVSPLDNRPDAVRLNALIKKYSGKPRPPRPCPCWSGKLLSECHATSSLPYPVKFLCECGSNEVYGKCCARRNILITEKWGDPAKQIVTTKSVQSGILQLSEFAEEGYQETLISILAYAKEHIENERLWTEAMKDALMFYKEMLAERLSNARSADGAYIFAVKILPFVVLPFDRNHNKVDCEGLARQWNETVDEYLASPSNRRSRVEVEQQAKVDNDGRPYFKRCEAAGCEKIETETGSYKRCSACQRIFYCGPACQTADWKAHKKHCKAGTHPKQMLHSQAELKKEITKTVEESLRKIQGIKDVSQAFKGDYWKEIVAIVFAFSDDAVLQVPRKSDKRSHKS